MGTDASTDVTARGSSPEAVVVSMDTLELLGLFPGHRAQALVERLRTGFAVLQTDDGPLEVPLDFLPACRPGDVLSLRRDGTQVRIAVDVRATARARLRFDALLTQLLPALRQ